MHQFIRNEKRLETIRIHKSEIGNIFFKDDGNEFLYNGEMYDVKSKSVCGDYLVFYCIKDSKEKQLLSGLDKHVKYNYDSKSSSEKKKNDSSKNPVKDLFVFEKNVSIQYSFLYLFQSVICNLQSAILFSPSPPPEVSFS